MGLWDVMTGKVDRKGYLRLQAIECLNSIPTPEYGRSSPERAFLKATSLVAGAIGGSLLSRVDPEVFPHVKTKTQPHRRLSCALGCLRNAVSLRPEGQQRRAFSGC